MPLVWMMEATLETLASDATDHGTTQRRVIADVLAKHRIHVAGRERDDQPRQSGRG